VPLGPMASCMKRPFAGKQDQRIEMMIVLSLIFLIVDYVSPILWTIGLTFVITGIVLVASAVGERSRGARGRRFPVLARGEGVTVR
jgi:hypothetical protein